MNGAARGESYYRFFVTFALQLPERCRYLPDANTMNGRSVAKHGNIVNRQPQREGEPTDDESTGNSSTEQLNP